MGVRPGGAYDEAAKSQKVSKARREHYKRHPVPIPDEKRCTRCNVLKDKSEFYIYTKKLEHGERQYLASNCKECCRERVAAIKKTKQREYGRRTREKMKKDPERMERRRRQQREYANARARRMGIAPGPGWKKYRITEKKGAKLPREPFAGWLSEMLKTHTYRELSQKIEVPERTISRVIAGNSEGKPVRSVSEELVDRALTNAGQPDQMVVLYPSD